MIRVHLIDLETDFRLKRANDRYERKINRFEFQREIRVHNFVWQKYNLIVVCGLWRVCVSGKSFSKKKSHETNNGFADSQQLAAIFSDGGRYSPQWSKFQIVATCLFCLFTRMCERMVCEKSANPNQNHRANPNRTSVVWCATPVITVAMVSPALIFQPKQKQIYIHNYSNPLLCVASAHRYVRRRRCTLNSWINFSSRWLRQKSIGFHRIYSNATWYVNNVQNYRLRFKDCMFCRQKAEASMPPDSYYGPDMYAMCRSAHKRISSATRLLSRAFECSLDTECVPFRFPRVLSPYDRLLSIVGKRVYQAAPRKFVTNCSDSHRHHHHRRRYITSTKLNAKATNVYHGEKTPKVHIRFTTRLLTALEICVGTICWGRNGC